MTVISNSAVSDSVRLAVQTNSTYSVQPTNDCTCSENRPTLPVENILSVCLVNSKQTFTLQLVYYSTLFKYYFAIIFY